MALFLAIIIIPLTAGEVYVRSLPNAAKSKHRWLTAHSREVDVLILGSSHTYYGVCPEVISRHAYSAAMVSQTLQYDDWLIHHYPFDRLRCVVVPISDFTLYEELEGGPEWYLANRYRLYMDCDIHPRLSVYDWELTAFPVFCEKLKTLYTPRRTFWSATGQGQEYTLENRPSDWDNGVWRAQHNRYTTFEGAPANERHLDNIASLAESHGARLLLISTPINRTYFENIDPRQQRDIQQRIIRFLARHPKVSYHDLRQDKRFTDDDFFDADHLNTRGARKLSAILRQYIGKKMG